jgi:hypothetical protein
MTTSAKRLACAALIGSLAAASLASPSQAHAGEITALVPFQNAPFPFDGKSVDGNPPFFDLTDGARRGHTTQRGGVYWEDTTYSDDRVLLHIPATFDPRKPALIVIYMHGNEATLERDVIVRQRIPEQIANTHANAVLVAPQFALDARDSSAGHFARPGAFGRFLTEAAAQLQAQLVLHQRVARGSANLFRRTPVIIVAYSGGYFPAAYAVTHGQAEARIRGVILFDALYGDEEKFADWIAHHRDHAFLFSAYTASCETSNLVLQELLSRHRLKPKLGLPAKLAPGTFAFLGVTNAQHQDFMTQAWVADPVTDMLQRVCCLHSH